MNFSITTYFLSRKWNSFALFYYNHTKRSLKYFLNPPRLLPAPVCWSAGTRICWFCRKYFGRSVLPGGQQCGSKFVSTFCKLARPPLTQRHLRVTLTVRGLFSGLLSYCDRQKCLCREPVLNPKMHVFCVIRQDSAQTFLPIMVF